MIDKKILKFYIVALIISTTSIIIPIISNLTSDFNQQNLYIYPLGGIAAYDQLIFYMLNLIVPYFGIFIGYGLATLIVQIYSKISKLSKRIEFVGYAHTDRSSKYLKRRYLIQILFATLLSLNIYTIIITNANILEFPLSETGTNTMTDIDGRLFNFVFVPWYWVISLITSILFSMCSVIIDSGLVIIKKIRGQKEFSDTERVGDKIFSAVKGYAGISVVINFIAIINSPYGLEPSLVLYPFSALTFLLHVIFAIDLFRNYGIKWIFKKVKKDYEPQIIELNFNKQALNEFSDLVNQ